FSPQQRSGLMPDGAAGHKWDCMKAVGNMVAAGVFERYPGLNLVLAEAGVGWIPFFAQEFDYYQMSFAPSPIGLGRQRDIPRPPSEYIYRQVYGAFIQDTVGCKLLPEYGSGTFMWSNDYPHSACIWPGATRFIAQDLGHLTPAARAKVLCTNAARLYNDGQLPPPADPPRGVSDLEAWNKVHWHEQGATALAEPRSRALEPQVLEWRRVWKAGNQPHASLDHALTDARERAQFVQGRVDHPVVQNALERMREGLALRPIELSRLTLEQVVDLGDHSVGVDPATRDVGLKPRGRVPGGAADGHDDAVELSLAERGEECRALHRPDACADANGLEVGGDGLAHGDVRGIRIEVAGIEPTRVAGLAQEAPGSGGIIGGGVEWQHKLAAPRDDRAGQMREAERLRLVQGLSIDRDARRLADALVVPGRFGVPLIGKVDPEDAKRPWRDHPQIWRAADLLGDGTADLVDDVHVALLDSRSASRLLG